MEMIRTAWEAKDYLVCMIAAEAKLEGVPLTEVERKMLYFSETSRTLPDIMEVNAEFDREYNEVEYEEKIGKLVRQIQERQDSEDEKLRDAWYSALEKLAVEDDYLLVLIDFGSRVEEEKPSRFGRLGPWLPQFGRSGTRPPGDAGRLVLAAIAVSVVLFVVMVLWVSIKR